MQDVRTNYFKLAWDDVRSSEGWAKKSLLLAALSLIPVFGRVVAAGYAYGWARDVAWGIREPLPRHVFGNEDGKLYSRGFFVVVLGIVCSLVPLAASSMTNALMGIGGSPWTALSQGHHWWPLVTFSGLFALCGSLVYLAFCGVALVFSWVGSMRIAIYDRISAGFQFGKVWTMARHDSRGLLGILGRYALAVVLYAVLVCVVAVIVALAVAAFGVAVAGMGLESAQHGSEAAIVLAVLLGLGVLCTLAVAVYLLFAGFAAALELTLARAMGLWTYQLDVAHWGGQDDPLPFE